MKVGGQLRRPTALLSKRTSLPLGGLVGPRVGLDGFVLCSTAERRHYNGQLIYVFCVELRTNSDYFPIQH